MSNSKKLPDQLLILTNDEIYDDGFLRVEHENFYVESGRKYLKLTRGEFLVISLSNSTEIG